MTPISASVDIRQTNNKDEDLLIGGQNYVSWLGNMQTYCQMKGREIWDYICGEAQEVLKERLEGARISEDEYKKQLKAGTGMALGHIRAGVHGNLEYLIKDSTSPVEAMNLLKAHCDLELSRMKSVVLKEFTGIKMDLDKGIQVFVAEFGKLEDTMRRVDVELPECFKKTVLIEALPDCMESDRAALERISATISLQTLKTEVGAAAERFLRRHGGKQPGLSVEQSHAVSDLQAAVQESKNFRDELARNRSSMEIEGQRAKRFGGTGRRDGQSKKCWVCGREGHISADCHFRERNVRGRYGDRTGRRHEGRTSEGGIPAREARRARDEDRASALYTSYMDKISSHYRN